MEDTGKRPHYHGHRTRLRERLQQDSRSLADYEILELLIGYVVPRRDTKPLAKELLARFSTIQGVFSARPGELRQVKGFGPALEAYWDLTRELWARIHESSLRERLVLNGPNKVAEMAMARIGTAPEEEFWLAMVDNKNRLIGWERVSSGTVDQAPVYPRNVLAMALDHKASGMIMVHNHPGGDPKPSSQDVDLTRRISKSAADLGIRMLDHLIVTDNDWYSFQSNGML